MTNEHKKNRESAIRFMLYLYKKYYPIIEEEMRKAKKGEEAQNEADVD